MHGEHEDAEIGWYPSVRPSPSVECCPDLTKRVCLTCRRDIPIRIHMLATNLVVAGALCAAFMDGCGRSVEQ